MSHHLLGRVAVDDLAQQAFLRAFNKLSQLEDNRHFGAWLKQLAINEWLQLLRRRDALRAAEEWEPADSPVCDQAAVALDLQAALAQLPDAVRLCVVLAYHENMSHGEIAASLELPLGTVKSHVRRGGARLRQLLCAYRDDGGES